MTTTPLDRGGAEAGEDAVAAHENFLWAADEARREIGVIDDLMGDILLLPRDDIRSALHVQTRFRALDDDSTRVDQPAPLPREEGARQLTIYELYAADLAGIFTRNRFKREPQLSPRTTARLLAGSKVTEVSGSKSEGLKLISDKLFWDSVSAEDSGVRTYSTQVFREMNKIRYAEVVQRWLPRAAVIAAGLGGFRLMKSFRQKD